MLVAVLLPSIAVLAGQLSTLRHKLRLHRVELEQALEQNRQLAIRDELTGLLQPPPCARADAAGGSARRAQRPPLCLALIDIDHFKRVNDQHGHAQGDEVLRAFAACASVALRDTDTLGRWGGEEFIVMLPETPADAAVGVLSRGCTGRWPAALRGLRCGLARELLGRHRRASAGRSAGRLPSSGPTRPCTPPSRRARPQRGGRSAPGPPTAGCPDAPGCAIISPVMHRPSFTHTLAQTLRAASGCCASRPASSRRRKRALRPIRIRRDR